MLKRSLIKRRLLAWLLGFLLFLAAGYALRMHYVTSKSDESIRRKYESVLHEKEQMCRHAFDAIKDSLMANENQALIYIGQNLLASAQDVSLFIFKSDSLVYWSDISTPIRQYFGDNTFCSGLFHTDNGWYNIVIDSVGSFRLVGQILLKNDYLYQNRHLRNRFAEGFGISENIDISKNMGDVNIYDTHGNFSHSLILNDLPGLNEQESNLVFLLFFLCFVCLLFVIYYGHIYIYSYFNSNIILVSGFIADVVLILLFITWFRIPEFVFDFHIFSPVLVSSSRAFASLGNYLLNATVILAAAMAFYKHFYIRHAPNIFNRWYILTPLAALSIIVAYHSSFRLIASLILNSTISLDLNDITRITGYSMAGFMVIGMIATSFQLFSSRVLRMIFSSGPAFQNHFVYVLLTGFFALYVFVFQIHYLNLVFLSLFAFPFYPLVKAKPNQKKFAVLLYFLFLISIFITLLLYRYNTVKENKARELLAFRVSQERDPVAEYKFIDIFNEMTADTALAWKVLSLAENSGVDQEVARYIKKKYFNDYWERFDLMVTVCDSSRLLDVQPDAFVINCTEYFNGIIQNQGRKTLCDGLYFVDYELGIDNYLAVVKSGTNPYSVNLYVELYPREIPRGPGYPELLIDEQVRGANSFSDYSMAKYKGNELVFNFGKYFYSTSLTHYPEMTDESGFFESNNYLHLRYSVNEYTFLISSKMPTLPEKIAPFSYLFIFFSLMVFLLMLFFRIPFKITKFRMNIRKRLQLSMVSLLLASFVIIGTASVYYIVRLNDDKNHDILSEKAHSVLVELEHKLASEKEINIEIQSYLADLLYKFSLVFFSDINMYDLQGSLLASSRPEIFSKGLISGKMDPSAYERMLIANKSLYIHNESIGDYRYLSAYLPFRNADNKLVAVLNLPYFARQDELTLEISTFLVAFVNIYVILIVITIVVALLISNYVSKPLILIREKIGRLKLGKANEKIDWPKKDEISGLVAEYNRMVDELAKSAAMLAQSERESAWREMAKQVAHEIKNPLTPMKLSIQHLKKAWDEKSPDWEKRLNRVTQNLIGQIDSLSVIASEFSNFAKMPGSKNETIEITQILRNAVDLFRDTIPIRMVLYADPEKKYFVMADKEQILRVFNNLLKNSIQAIEDPASGLIEITLKGHRNSIVIFFSDNGAGIPDAQKEKVFFPSFTTKSSGMGLGLAMAKNIIVNAGGTIEFESVENRGTTFIITLPLIKDE
ncbi:MAG: GHKL domain-containing protein [Bacteroidales bacterium]|nr:GHKL domain-containing protein [Bacteroidales bacterium]